MDLFNSLLFMLNEMSPYILLGFLIAGLMHAYVSRKTLARHLSGNDWRTVIKSALIGVPLPLCSCGVLPTAIAMKRSGASKGATASFLIATPQTGVDSISATWSLLGPAFAIVRPLAALTTAVFGGLVVGRTDKAVETVEGEYMLADERPQGWAARLGAALRYGFVDLVGSIGGWLVAGLIIAALITVYVPDDFFEILGNKPFLSMIAVLIIAIPMYVCATGSIPIAMSLMLKGLSPGTALVLLMAGPAANFASFTLISREMGRKSATIYLAAIVVGAMAFGLAIDYLVPSEWFRLKAMAGHGCHSAEFSPFATLCSILLVALLIYSFAKRYIKFNNKTQVGDMTKEYVIKGMNCAHCQAAVTKSISSVPGVESVDVNLSTKKAVVTGEHNADDVVKAVAEAGFEVVG
ncbi:MAG: permease [Muribaculaceae bacterium]|nr:permease [Muribaculaceae bacterium]